MGKLNSAVALGVIRRTVFPTSARVPETEAQLAVTPPPETCWCSPAKLCYLRRRVAYQRRLVPRIAWILLPIKIRKRSFSLYAPS